MFVCALNEESSCGCPRSISPTHAGTKRPTHSTRARTQVAELQSSIGAQNTYMKEAFSSNRSVQNNVLRVLITRIDIFTTFTTIVYLQQFTTMLAARRPRRATRASKGSSAQLKKFCLACRSPLLSHPAPPPPARPSRLCTRHRCTHTHAHAYAHTHTHAHTRALIIQSCAAPACMVALIAPYCSFFFLLCVCVCVCVCVCGGGG